MPMIKINKSDAELSPSQFKKEILSRVDFSTRIDKAELVRLYKANTPVRKIAEALGFSHQAIYDFIKRHELTRT